MPAKKKPTVKESAPALTPLKQREIREEWTPADLACRDSRAKALRILRAHYRKVDPQFAGTWLLACRLAMGRAVIDLLALDGALKGKRPEPYFNFMEDFAVFHTAEALQALHFLAWNSINSKTSPAQQAYKKGDELAAHGKLILHQFRERPVIKRRLPKHGSSK